MPEMTPDPVFDKLARFTPDASTIDPAEILFRAGRATARTNWGWKFAVVGLLLANVAWMGERLLHEPKPAPDSLEVVPVIVVVPVAIPTSEPSPSPSAVEPGSPWSLGALRTTDPDNLPGSPALGGLSPTDPPLTPRSRSEID